MDARKVVKTGNAGGVLWLDLDSTEHRYLLTASVHSSVAIYDMQVPLLLIKPILPLHPAPFWLTQ
jgi:hypothetical protein